MLRIGLTGGIASGKSTVAELFHEQGAAIIDTDVIAREVVQPGSSALAKIRKQFGERVIGGDGSLDRPAMRSIVFSDDAKRRALEAILHPRIQAETMRQSAAAEGPYQMIVVPLLVESPLRHNMDRILVVDCDPAIQLQRLLERDAQDEQQAHRMIAAQASRDERLAIADDIVDNSGQLDATREQVARLHGIYMQQAVA